MTKEKKNVTESPLEKAIEWSLLALNFVWFCILIGELVQGMSPVLYALGTGIWIFFIVYFSVRLAKAKDRLAFLNKNWVFVLAILVSVLRLVPFLQRLPLVRAATATFGMQTIWIFASADRGMRGLRKAFGRRGVEYAVAFTLIVIVAGAAGMLSCEKESLDPNRIQSYSKALWWTAMQMTNIGSSYSPTTPGGRALCLGISIYAVAMFGYLTALLATVLIGHDTKVPTIETLNQKSIRELKEEMLRLSQLIESAVKRLDDKK